MINHNDKLELNRTERVWAFVRLGFGQVQTIGAIVSVLILLATGVSQLTILVTSVTACFTGLSLLMWAGKDDNAPFRWIRRHCD